MNNPFEWLREQYTQRKSLWEDKSVVDRVSAEKHIGTWNKALEILNVAEKKWNEENSEVSNVFNEEKYDEAVLKIMDKRHQLHEDLKDALVAIDNMRQDIRSQAISDVAEAIRQNFVFSNREDAIRFSDMMDTIMKQLKEK